MTPQTRGRSRAAWAFAGALAALTLGALTLSASAGWSEGLERDSDDFNCSHGAVEDPRTIQACANLRGAPVTAEEIARDRRMGFQRASDDWNCHHARPGSHRRAVACRRLRGD